MRPQTPAPHRNDEVSFRGHHRGVNYPIEASVTFQVPTARDLQDIFAGKKAPHQGWYVYGRSFSPTVQRLGQLMADIEGTDAGYACSSGMAAMSSVIMALCNTGDHIVASDVMYGGTYTFLAEFLPQKAGIKTTFVPVHDLEAVAAAITPQTKMMITEVVANPTLKVADIAALADIAHSRGAKLVVDNTFTPLIVSPARWGADVVVHSLTKFVSGGGDMLGGCVCGPAALVNQMLSPHGGSMMMLGPTMDPKAAHELSLRLPHLPLRMREHSRRAAAMAELLHSLGAKVNYPGLSSNPQHDVLQRLINPGYGFGGLLTVDMGSAEKAAQLVDELQNEHDFGIIAVSLGFFDTLMSISAASTASTLPAGAIPDGLVRMSVGITGSLEERLQQLEAAYVHVTAAVPSEQQLSLVSTESDAQLVVLSVPDKRELTITSLDAASHVESEEENMPVTANHVVKRRKLEAGDGSACSDVAVSVDVGGVTVLAFEIAAST